VIPSDQMKASLFNLIIYTHEQQRTDYFMEIVHSIIEKFPCRVIFIQTDHDSEISITKETIGQEQSYVSCDLITISSSTEDLNYIPFVVLEHLVPDLPVYLIWGQNPTKENPLLPHLLKFANRIVFDSECTPNLRQFSELMLSQIQSSQIDILDVDWALISRWRHVLAQIFDTSEKIDLLNSSSNLTITYNDRLNPYNRHNDTRAIYLQGWLAAQLEWKFESIKNQDGDLHLTYVTSKGKTNVILHPANCEKLRPGSILEVKAEGSKCGTIDITRYEDQPKVTIHISNHDTCDLPYNLPLFDPQRGLTFVKEMFFYRPSDHYHRMLKSISEVNWESA